MAQVGMGKTLADARGGGTYHIDLLSTTCHVYFGPKTEATPDGRRATLREAQKKPEDYRSLLVRVAGYSDYFVDLDRNHQEEIISRTAQEGF